MWTYFIIFFSGLILGGLFFYFTRYDPESVIHYKHFEAFRDYAEDVTRFIRLIELDSQESEIIMKLDSLVLLSGYDRTKVFQMFEEVDRFVLSTLSDLEKSYDPSEFPIINDRIKSLRNSRAKVLHALKEVYKTK